jgi:acyl-CoA dehydrogenase
MPIDFSSDPEFDQQLAWMESFVREEVWPLEVLDVEWREAERLLEPLKAAVKERGLWAAHLPPELGGQGFGQVKLGLMHEVLGTSTFLAPLAFGNAPPDSGNSEILALVGTPEQKRDYLEPLLAGELRSCFSMTEPETPGSDPTQLATRAVRDGEEYVISGRKWFTSNASIADFAIVMAVTDPEEAPHRRASMLIVPLDTPGVRVVRDVPTMEHVNEPPGAYLAHGEVEYDEVRVPREALLGAEGEGFKIAQQRLGPGRIHHCMRWIGVCNRAFEMLCERALSRSAHGSPLAEKQTVQNWIADSATQIHAARLMTLHAAWVIDTQGTKAARKEIAMIKVFGAEAMHDVLDRAIQVHGALGYSGDLPLEAMQRYARAARIYDGPDEVHRQSIARLLLRERQAAPDGVPSEHVPTRRAAALERYGPRLTATGVGGEEVPG